MKTLLPQASRLLWLLWLAALMLGSDAGRGATPLPPKPSTYVSDEAGLLDPGAAQALRLELEQFERDTSNQVVVATFPRLPEGEALEDFTQRTAQAWRVGQADRNNGAILFVFRDDRKMRLEVGYGLEGVIPDSLAARIMANEIRPRFRANDYQGGIQAGARAMMAATRGEYGGTGDTVAEREAARARAVQSIIVGLFFLLLIVLMLRSLLGDTVYRRSGRRRVWGPVSTGDWTSRNAGGGQWGGGSWGGGGGGWSSGGGGGFSGGGGSFGGGGASGDW